MLSPDYNKRGYLLPKGCKDLIDVINLQRAKARPACTWPVRAKDAEMSQADIEALQAAIEGDLKASSTQAPKITGEILVSETTTVAELAALLGEKPFKIIADLMELGTFANLNQPLSFQTVCQVVRKYGYTAKRLP